ncbi:prepilin peptidase [Neogemmobacter tilapiae]|uniref:Membrane protein n=1 Tax=Neogemmobacter tilapiae TaxID=875041 RepID=A0A918WGI7_9RHOB|nr:prepilin peptidase [Gemmobacter tilapiae]GHC49201.1 membrane protein [Gemmobacter tilapiae]
MLVGTQALIALALATPIAIWAAWSDMATMKIPNKAVLALAAVFLASGPFLLPWNAYLWGLGILGITLIIGFVLSSIGMVGAGDAKLATAMAPFFVGGDVAVIMFLVAACMIGALILHRIAKGIGPIRRATENWASWSAGRYFPFGLALSAMLVIYLALMGTIGAAV